MSRRTRLFACLLLACASSTPALADTIDTDLLLHLQWEEQQLRMERAELPAFFAEAYAMYPQIPTGTLEAIAYSQSRWQSLKPEPGHEAHHHMPAAYGVMGLYGGDGFIDQLGKAARVLDVAAARIATDDRLNILAAAALLAQELDTDRFDARNTEDIESIAPALARYAGFTTGNNESEIEDFARASFAFDVLLALDRGVNDKGMVVPERPIRWERAFDPAQLVQLQAPFVRLDVSKDKVETDDVVIDPVTETLIAKEADNEQLRQHFAAPKSSDYAPAIWNPAHPGNYIASRSAPVSAVTIHTMQGTYAGSISWFKNPTANVSAHYMIRSSDGQVTQMVREAHTAQHVRNNNSYTLGVEHEGWVNNSAWYTTAMYNASSALVRHFCNRYSRISCDDAYNGNSSSGVVVLPSSIAIKGHQHFSGNSHTDPGINWDWRRYYRLLNPSSGGGGTVTIRMLDSFESDIGHFDTSPTYSGSTVGISTASSAARDCAVSRHGDCSLRVKLVDNPATAADWEVRLLSGSGNPSANGTLARANGRLGFWVYTGGTGMSVAVGIDDSDGTERSISRALEAGTWTYVQWNLDDATQWGAWAGGNGAVSATNVTLDAIWLLRDQTSFDVFVYVDEVQLRTDP